jgi:hypothetical protein
VVEELDQLFAKKPSPQPSPRPSPKGEGVVRKKAKARPKKAG